MNKIQELIKSIEKINIINEKVRTIDKDFIKAVKTGSIKNIKLLLDQGANIDVFIKKEDNNALMSASIDNDISTVKLLLDMGANINIKNIDGNTALALAASKGNLNITKLLLKNKANINSKNIHGNTVLNFAVWLSNDSKTIEFLLSKGAKGKDLLITAMAGGNKDIIKLFFDKASAKEKNIVLLDVVGDREGPDMNFVKALLNSGADINFKDKVGNTPLMVAIMWSPFNTVKFLLDNGANTDFGGRSFDGLTQFRHDADKPKIKKLINQHKKR